MTDDAERRHEGPSYWVATSLADLISCEADVAKLEADVAQFGDDDHRQILADLRREIARRQAAIKEAERA